MEVIHLASIGEPLSQCDTPRALVDAFYDLLETLDHMWEEDVLHRDVSWFNVLIKPKHYTRQQKPLLQRPCIQEVMQGLRPSAAEAEPSAAHPDVQFSSSILLTDLDHSITKEVLQTNPNAGREKTGTPMFMSVELSDFGAMRYRYPVPMSALEAALEAVEQSPEGRVALQRAFPGPEGDKDFMANFKKVMKLEVVRYDGLPLDSRPCHRPRHDAESAFWVFLWGAIRALPRDAGSTTPPPATHVDAFTNFCETMLAHEVADGRADTRSQILTAATAGGLERLFHPLLKPFIRLFEIMALYLCVPWHHYEQKNMVNENHVHVAFRRLLIHFGLTADLTMLGLKLDTEHPRVMVSVVDNNTERISSVPSCTLAQVRASLRDSPLSGLPDSDRSTSIKRKATEGPDRGTGSSKRLATKARQPNPAQPAPAQGPPPPPPPPDYSALAIQTYNEAAHAHLRTCHALRLKFWKDRQLWFSKGE
ncbi:hypothetical protein AURDEDRAFT_149188 [Auricularia subglabra TFB-10046 SS5]|nr:hypothetical protein AURDEDRAFT_149188 [Auricularia subglabra TFB-10046 SS5]